VTGPPDSWIGPSRDGVVVLPGERDVRRRVRGAVLAGHIGLAACTERVGAIGGAVEVRSAPGRGTSVRAVLPPNALLPSRAFL
jgi:signal transduction histidine kinase